MTQTLRPVLIGLLPALAAAVLLALIVAGRLAPSIPVNPVIDLPRIGADPTTAPAAPARTADAAPLVEDTKTAPAVEPAAPARESAAPANPTTMPGLGSGPTATAAPGASIPPPSRPAGDQDPWPYPNLPNGKGPLGQ